MSPRGRLIWGGLTSLVLLLAGAKIMQNWLFARALRTSVAAIKELDVQLPGHENATQEDGYFFPLFPFGELNTEQVLVGEESPDGGRDSTAEVVSKKAGKAALAQPQHKGSLSPASEPPVGPEPKSSHVSAEAVLGWANAQVMPRGRSVTAGHGLRAGIEIFDASGFGLGVVDGDRLVAVDGSPVSSRTDVVGLVLAARGREQEQITATLMRLTASGPATYSVVLEQPYLTFEELMALDVDHEKEEREAEATTPEPDVP